MKPISQTSALGEADFVATLGGIFEHAPWVAEAVYAERPFVSVADLHASMCRVVAEASEARQLGLIRAHPDLAGRAARAGDLTESSTAEQSGAGLDSLSESEYSRFHTLNDAYRARFGFPFVLAVKGHTKTSILDAFEARLEHDPEAERETALEEIYKIAGFRLAALLEDA